jgi:hypothetical protein
VETQAQPDHRDPLDHTEILEPRVIRDPKAQKVNLVPEASPAWLVPPVLVVLRAAKEIQV